MRSVKRQLTIISILMVIIIAALTLGGLQIFGKGKVKPSEWFKKADPPQAEQTEQIEQEKSETASAVSSMLLAANSSDNDYQEYSVTHESTSYMLSKSTSFRNWYAKRPSNLRTWTYTLKLDFICKESSCTTNNKNFAFNYGIVYEESEYIDEGDGEYSTMNYDANSLKIKYISSGNMSLKSECDSKASTKFSAYTSPTFTYRHVHGQAYDYVVFTLTESKFTLTVGNSTICSVNASSDVYKQAFYILNNYSSLSVSGDASEPTTFNPSKQKARVVESIVMDARVPVSLPEEPTKEGHTFAGWYYGTQSEHGDNCVAYAGEPIYSNTNLHAHFNINRYTVTYDSNGGEAVNSETIDWNTAAPTPTPERIGYNFLGWHLADGTVYNGAGIKANTKLTAQWEIKVFTVTFYVDGDNGEEVYKSLDIPYGSTLVEAMEEAEISSFRAMNMDGLRVSKQSVITEDTNVLVNELTGWEKYGDFVARNSWYSWLTLGVVCGLLVISSVSIVVAVKRK